VAHTLKGAALIPASLQQLADEAFADLLAKHHRPRTFKVRGPYRPMRTSPAVANETTLWKVTVEPTRMETYLAPGVCSPICESCSRSWRARCSICACSAGEARLERS
jgi:hypothetical protein